VRMLRFIIPSLLLLAAFAVALPAIAGTQENPHVPRTSNGLTATVGSGKVALRWRTGTVTEGIKGYAVWRRANPGSNWTQIGRTRALTYTDPAVAAGHGYAYAVRAYDSPGNLSASSMIVTAKVPGIRTDMGATGFRRLVPPPFKPTSTVTAKTPSRFATDLAELKAGERLNVKPMTIPGEYFISKKLRSYAEIHFARGVVFSGATDFEYYTVQISNSSNIRIYGGRVMNPTNGSCVRVTDSTNIVWWHFHVLDCASTGMVVGSTIKNSTGIDLDGTIDHVAYDTSFDPHAEKCTGIHGLYLGGNPTYSVSGKISVYVNDSVCGAGIQVGCHTRNTELWLRADHLPYVAQHQTAGNAIQFWCNNLSNITVHDVVANDIAGRVINTDGVYAGGMSNVVVRYGRGTDTLHNARFSRINYDESTPGITYMDVAPRP
jgi:hypothetical protein